MAYLSSYERKRRQERAEKRAAGLIPKREQQRGTCQICARDVAVEMWHKTMQRYRTSKHGYTVEKGWGFSGTCMGSDTDPYEMSKSMLFQYIEMAKGSLASMRMQAQRIREGKVEQLSEDVRDYNKPKRKQITTEARTAADFPRKVRWSYKEETWEAFCVKQAENIERSANSLEEHIKGQEARIEVWKFTPEKIRTVMVEVSK